jgi:superfamily II DNA or RNA helicase
MIQFRPYQSEGIHKIRAAMSQHRRIVYVLPTGGGKTMVFCGIAQMAIQKGKKVMILVHRDSLFRQTSESLNKFNVRHGLIGSGYTPAYIHLCQVAKVGTVVNRLERFVPDLIIVDECHHATAMQYRKIIEAYPNAYVLGVTATPCRTDGTGLGEIFQEMILGPQIYELIEMGFLTSAREFAPETIDTFPLPFGPFPPEITTFPPIS